MLKLRCQKHGSMFDTGCEECYDAMVDNQILQAIQQDDERKQREHHE